MSEDAPNKAQAPTREPMIANETVSALAALAASFLAIYLLAGIGHPYLLGIGEAPDQGPTKVQNESKGGKVKGKQGKGGRKPAGTGK